MTRNARGPVVLDASAVLGWRDDEPGSHLVDQVLERGVISAVNLGEVEYKIAEFGDDPAAFTADLAALGVVFLPFTATHSRLLPELKALDLATRRRRANAGTPLPKGRKLSLGDLCCLATAIDLAAPVLTGDRYWTALELPIKVTDYRTG